MKKYKASETLKEHVIKILNRRNILHELETEAGVTYCCVSLNSKEFHKIVLRAKMEKHTEERNSHIPFIAECELDDALLRQEVGNAFPTY